MKIALVRIGIDASYGAWNAPVDPETCDFVYVPIPEVKGAEFHPNCRRSFRELLPALSSFQSRYRGADGTCVLPTPLHDAAMHLDPDFETLTYGDVGDRRGLILSDMARGDMVVFYASLRPIRKCDHKLIYALVGKLTVDEVLTVANVEKQRWNENAHTRKVKRGASDIVVRGDHNDSGRFERCIPIGEFRERAYRVRQDVLAAWGGLSVSNGYIQRSARPPMFNNPSRFRRWLDKQQPKFLRTNWGAAASSPVIIVMLRRPNRSNPREQRTDPFWEFGSFGCTGCHRTNVMNPKRLHEVEGVRLAFAQGGDDGLRLVHLTPPVEVLRHAKRNELKWKPAKMPFRYDDAPVLVRNDGFSHFPALLQMIRRVDRTTWVGRFSSKFRSRRRPVPEDVSTEMCSVFDRLRSNAGRSAISRIYADALPYPPPSVDHDRASTYHKLTGASQSKRRRGCTPKGTRRKGKC